MPQPLDFQSIIFALQRFWAEQGCLIWQPYHTEVGAGTMNPATFLRVLGPEPWNVAYVEPSIRPDDGRYGENPNRLNQHTQFLFHPVQLGILFRLIFLETGILFKSGGALERAGGVTTVVAKLFNGVQPQRAYFGQKDAQQARVIQQMVRDLNYPIEIVVCPIRREPDGLAMSSRNTYLNPAERKAATVLYRALSAAKAAFQQGERDADRLRQIMEDTINAEPLARLQYVSCADPDTLEELHGEVEKALLSMAVFVGKTRLIDNMLIGTGKETF
jgi:hypothetical protein